EYVNALGGREFLRENLLMLIGVFALVAATSGLCELARLYAGHNLSENLGYNMRQSVFEHLQKATFTYHKNVQTGDIIQRCSSDIDMVRSFVVEMTQIVRIVAQVSIAYWFMWGISPKLALISFISVPTISGFSIIYYSKIQKKFLVADEAEGELQAMVQENLTAPRVVRAFGKQGQELERFSEKNQNFTRLWIKVGDLLAFFWAGGDILTALQVVLVLCMSTIFAVNGEITTGEVVSFMAFNGMLMWPIRSLSKIIGNMSKATVALERINEIMEADSENYEEGADFVFEKEIEFKNVSFSFENQRIFDGLSFKIKKGQTVAVLGASGSGKSTILALLSRFYHVQEGEILIDGVNIENIKLGSLRKNIGLVMQEPFLFSKTIRENIAVADKNIEEERVFKAAKTAQIHDSILNFQKGYDTIVGEKGVTLSGGQKQRVAIARTLYTNAPVLCFDDSLSAVDSVTDRKIRHNLKHSTQNLTTVIISQRVNTLMQADNILVLAQGKIVQQGDHNTLIQQAGIYSEIVKIQQDIIQKTQMEAGDE
ncbi:MAG: ABC transporter ATP-binding protein, partial [Oscillospiraceae bacterium]